MFHRRARLSRTVSLALLAGLLVAAPTPAQAESQVSLDPRSDMMWVHTPPDDDNDSTPPHVLHWAPQQTNRDIVRSRIRHTSSRVQLRITFADLRRTGAFNQYDVYLVTNEGVERWVTIFTGPGRWAGEFYTEGYPRNTRCALHRAVDYAANVVVIGFPRRCVGHPRWIRVATGTSGGGDQEEDYFYDDALRRGLDPLRPDQWRLSPRVGRG